MFTQSIVKCPPLRECTPWEKDMSYPILFVWTKEKKNNNKRQNKESMILSHSKQCSYVLIYIYYACAILSLVLLASTSYGSIMQVKYLDIWLLWGCGVNFEGLVFWSVRVLEVSEGTFLCCKYFLCFCFFVWMYVWCKSMWFDFLSVERLSSEVWRCLDFKAYLTVLDIWGFLWRCSYSIAHDLRGLSIDKFLWECKAHLRWRKYHLNDLSVSRALLRRRRFYLIFLRM